MVVASKWGNDCEPDDDWYYNLRDDPWEIYQDVDVQWAYRDLSTIQLDRPQRISRVATVLLSR